MKKIITICLITFFTQNLISQNWEYVGDSRFTDIVYLNHFNMTATHDGKPIVFYKPNSQSSRARSLIFEENTWSSFGAPEGFGPGSESELNIETDNNNNIIWAFEAVRGYGYDEDGLLASGTGAFSIGRTNYLDLTISKQNNVPFVVYADEARGNRASVKKFNNVIKAWETVGDLAFTENSVIYSVIAIDSNEVPYIAFQDRAQNRKISVMKFDGTNWVYLGNAGFMDSRPEHVALAINSQNEVFLFFSDKNNNYKGVVKKFDGTNWVNLGNSDVISTNRATFCELKFDDNDIPYFAYQDGENDGKATVKRFVNNTWEVVGQPGFSNRYVTKLSLHFDKSSNLFLGINEYDDSGYRGSVMRFDTSVLSTNDIAETKSKIEVFPNPTTNFINVKTTEIIKQLKIINVLGQELLRQKHHQIDITNLNSGVYLLSVETANGQKVTQKIIKK